jgi:hypothetical protein
MRQSPRRASGRAFHEQCARPRLRALPVDVAELIGHAVRIRRARLSDTGIAAGRSPTSARGGHRAGRPVLGRALRDTQVAILPRPALRVGATIDGRDNRLQVLLRIRPSASKQRDEGKSSKAAHGIPLRPGLRHITRPRRAPGAPAARPPSHAQAQPRKPARSQGAAPPGSRRRRRASCPHAASISAPRELRTRQRTPPA